MEYSIDDIVHLRSIPNPDSPMGRDGIVPSNKGIVRKKNGSLLVVEFDNGISYRLFQGSVELD